MSNRNWRLPTGVGELLPPDAWALELTRRRVLDVFRAWGFEYIDPPVVEYLDALLVGSGDDMDLQTLKALDQSSGRFCRREPGGGRWCSIPSCTTTCGAAIRWRRCTAR